MVWQHRVRRGAFIGEVLVTERDYVSLAADYQADVLAGRIAACQWVRYACARNRKDLDRQETPDFPFRFDPKAARKICQFAEMLPHIEGPKAKVLGTDDADRPIWNTIALEPWQCWVFTTLMGWRHTETGYRRFRVGLVLVPRGNGKSVMGAIVSLYMLTADGESGAQCYSAATTRDQAKIVAKTVWEMAKRSPRFCEYFGVKTGAKTTRVVEVPETASVFMPLSADANSLDGLNTHLGLIDELHAHKTRHVYDVIDTSLGKRPQSLLLAITTAGVEIGGICHEKLGYLEKVLDGTAVDEHFFGINYTIDEADLHRIQDTEIQRKANPNYGVSVEPDKLAQQIHASQFAQSALNNILTKHFNVWVRSEAGWMTNTTWQTCADLTLTLESLKAFPLYIGVDLGETRDPSSLALLFKTGLDTYAFIPRIYMPAEVVARSPIAELSGWVRIKDIIQTPGNEADYARISADLLELFRDYQVKEIDFDKRSARLMMQDLRAKLEPSLGRDRVEKLVLDIPQSLDTMDPAMKTTEALVLGKKIRHDGNRAMGWMIGNIVVERDHKGQIYPRKAGGKDSHFKIDGAIALFTALSRAMQPAERTPSYSMLVLGSGTR
jgi:phage terminase large subunit-like protein